MAGGLPRKRCLPAADYQTICWTTSCCVHNGTFVIASDVGTFTVDRLARPAAMDVLLLNGRHRPRFLPAIFERAVATLRICYDLSGGQRPRALRRRHRYATVSRDLSPGDRGGSLRHRGSSDRAAALACIEAVPARVRTRLPRSQRACRASWKIRSCLVTV